MNQFRKVCTIFLDRCRDTQFLEGLEWFVGVVSKVLALAMVFVILVMLVDLARFLIPAILDNEFRFFQETITEIFGAFLSILIALELLENITAYLQRHAVQVELVIITSLIAVARKIIILDLSKVGGTNLIGLALAIFALSISYWIVRRANQDSSDEF